MGGREQEAVWSWRVLLDVLRESLCNRRWERDLPDTCPRLWWTEYGAALPDSDELAIDDDLSLQEQDPVLREAEDLTAAHTRAGREQNRRTQTITRCLGRRLDLLGRPRLNPLLHDLGELDPDARRPGDPAILDGVLQDRAHVGVRHDDSRGSVGLVQGRHELLDHCLGDRAQRLGADDGVDPLAQRELDKRCGGRPEDVRGPPRLCVLLERHLPGVGYDIRPGDCCGRLRIEPGLGVPLPSEVLGVLLAGIVDETCPPGGRSRLDSDRDSLVREFADERVDLRLGPHR